MRIVQLFICRDQKSKQLLDELNTLIKPFRNEVELKVHIVHIKKPEDFENFMLMMEELFGGISTLIFRKYDIKKIPAIIIDDRKILEGKYPSKEELEDLLTYEGIIMREVKKAPAVKAEKPGEIAPPVSAPVKIIKPSVEELLPQKEKIKEIEEIPYEVETTPSSQGQRELEPIPVIEKGVEIPSIEKPVEPKQKVTEFKKEAEIIEKRVKERKPKRVCTTCIFYNEATKRCAMLGKMVEDPENPPCQW